WLCSSHLTSLEDLSPHLINWRGVNISKAPVIVGQKLLCDVFDPFRSRSSFRLLWTKVRFGVEIICIYQSREEETEEEFLLQWRALCDTHRQLGRADINELRKAIDSILNGFKHYAIL